MAELCIAESPKYAIADSAVKLAKVFKETKHVTSFINAITRRITKDFSSDGIILKPTLHHELCKILESIYGTVIIDKFHQLFAERAPVDITIKDEREIKIWKNKLNAKVLPFGSLRLKKNVALSSLAGFKEGKWWVQGVASSIPVKLLNDISGSKVLDVFSAPGGKTMQLISAGARVTCLDISPTRLDLLRKNLHRTGMNAEIISTDFRQFKTREKYDVVILDAPCSSTGTIVKNKELSYLFNTKSLHDLIEIQKESLMLAKDWVNDEGIILYCTCSLLPSEGEDQIANFLSGNPDWKQKKISLESYGIKDQCTDDFGNVRLRPDFLYNVGGMDGFFASILCKGI